MIYLDYAATSLARKDIIEKINNRFEEFYGNPDSSHAYGRRTKKILEDSREKIAKSINTSPLNIVFTSGASEANNTIINHFNHEGYEIITTKIEHPSILEPLTMSKADVKYVELDEKGHILYDQLDKFISEKTKLISIILVNNEMGALQNIEKIKKIIGTRDIWLHLDCVQAYGHYDLDVEKLACDSLSISGHKIGGLNGFGCLYLRKHIDSLILGGNQEKKRRAGTSNVMAAFSMAQAYQEMVKERAYIEGLKNYLLESLDKSGLSYELNGQKEDLRHIVNIYLPFAKSDFMLTYLDMKGIYVSAGSACTAGSLEPSHVIEALYDKDRALRSLRISLGYQNKRQDIDSLIEALLELEERNK